MTSPATTSLPPLAARLSSVGRSVVRDLLALTEDPGIISFAGGLPAPELFDVAGLRTSYDAVLSSGPAALQYSTTEGHRALREHVADRYSAIGLPTHADEIIMTTGSQQGLTLLAAALITPGDVVLVERPSYLAALQVFALAGARIVEVPAATDGLDLDALDDLAREHAPVALYTVPTFQNPTGRTLGHQDRARLAQIAATRGFRVIEDDPYRELRYSGTPVPPVAAYDEASAVVATGSFSKILAPGLRLGWVRTTPDTRGAVVVAKQASDLHTSTLDQAAAAHYLASGALEVALPRTRDAYRLRRDAMLAALPSTLPAGSSWTTPEGGMFVWATLPEGFDTTALLPRAIEAAVAYVPGAPFHATSPDTATMRLSFTTHSPETTSAGLARLAPVLAAHSAEATASPAEASAAPRAAI